MNTHHVRSLPSYIAAHEAADGKKQNDQLLTNVLVIAWKMVLNTSARDGWIIYFGILDS